MARLPRFDRLDDRIPHVRFLSNGSYTVAITSAGSGYSSSRGVALTGWSPDRTEDGLGTFLYLRDRDDGAVWSATYQPTRVVADPREAISTAGRVRFTRVDHEIETVLELCVDPARDCEIRRLVVTNRSSRERRIEVTSYAEIVLAPLATQHGHPAFAKLFVQTEYDAAGETLLASRRPRGRGERRTWAAHRLIGEGSVEHETDRARFIGRGRTLGAPAALMTTTPLSGTTGNVLDPLFSLRRTLSLAPGASARLDLVLAFGDSREQALGFVGIDPRAIDAVFEAAVEHEREMRKRSKIRDRQAESLQELAGHALYCDPELVPGERRPAEKAYLAALGLEAAPVAPPIAPST